MRPALAPAPAPAPAVAVAGAGAGRSRWQTPVKAGRGLKWVDPAACLPGFRSCVVIREILKLATFRASCPCVRVPASDLIHTFDRVLPIMASRRFRMLGPLLTACAVQGLPALSALPASKEVHIVFLSVGQEPSTMEKLHSLAKRAPRPHRIRLSPLRPALRCAPRLG